MAHQDDLPDLPKKFMVEMSTGSSALRIQEIKDSALKSSTLESRFGLSESVQMQMVQNGELSTIIVQGESVFPSYQFTNRGLLPFIAEISKVIRRPIYLMIVDSFFRRSQADLYGLTPREWLMMGNDPEPVIGMAAEL